MAERSSTALTQPYLTCIRDQHPTDTAPVLTKLPSEGQEMEVAQTNTSLEPSSHTSVQLLIPCWEHLSTALASRSLCNLGPCRASPCPSAHAGSSGRGTAGSLHRVGAGGQQPAWAMPAASSMPRALCSLPAPQQSHCRRAFC